MKKTGGIGEPQDSTFINFMNLQDKSSLHILMDNQELLQKIPSYLGKHLQIYQNIHKDIDANDQHSIHYMRSPENTASNLEQFIAISSQFAQTISRLKQSFTELYNRYNPEHDPEKKKKVPVDDKEKPRISNFDMFVSEHCKNSIKTQLKSLGEPACDEEIFDEMEIEERSL